MYKLVLISGDGCASCFSMVDIVSSLAKKLEIEYVYYDVNKEIIEKYQVEAIPTVIMLHQDKILNRIKGYIPQEVLEIWALDAMQRVK